MDKNNLSLLKIIKKINREYPLVPHTNAGRLYSTVRRMKAEKEMEIPINLRTGFPVSVATGKHANEMEGSEWENFYGALSEQLKHDYPELYERIFGVATLNIKKPILFNFIHRQAFKLYRRDLINFIGNISKLNNKELSDLVVHAVWTRAGLQSEGRIMDIRGVVFKDPILNQYPILLPQFRKIVNVFESKKAFFEAASMSIWVHTLRALIDPNLESEMHQMWDILLKSKSNWEDSLRELYDEDIKKIDTNLVESTLILSKQIILDLPPKPKIHTDTPTG